MSSNTNIGNTPVNQGYVQLIHTGETGGIDGTLRTLYDGDGTASDLQIASNKVKVSTELYIGSKTATEFIQDIVGSMFTTGSYTNITTTYDDTNGNIDLSASGEVTLTGTQTLTNKTLASPTFTGTANGVNLTLSGDLTVNGTTTTLDTTNLKVTDNLIELNQGVASNANDSGIIIERGSTGDNAIIMWDESADKFTLGTTTATADATGNIIITTGTLVASTFEGNLTGNVTGSASLNLLTSNNLSDLANAATARTNLGVDAAGTDNSTDVTLAGTLDYITIVGQTITRNAIDLTTDVTGTLPVGNGGTGLTSISTLLNSNVTPTSLGLVIGTDVQAQDTLLQDIADFSLSNPSQDGYLIAYSDAEPQLELVAPGISFNGSTANGLLTYGNSTTADVETDLVYTATGLGVGTTSPSGKLDVEDTTGSLSSTKDITAEFMRADGTYYPRLQVRHSTSGTNIYHTYSTGASLLTFGNGGTADAMAINSSGNVGIGTSILDAGAKLNVVSGSTAYTAQFSRLDADDGLFLHSEAASTHYNWLISTQDNVDAGFEITPSTAVGNRSFTTPAFVIKADTGNVGIGTVSPNRLLHLQSTGDAIMQITSADGSGAYIDLGDVSDVDGGRIVYDSGSNLLFNTASTEKLRITSGGNVGIGTSSPGAKLDVKSQINVTNSNNNSLVGLKGTEFGFSDTYRVVQVGNTSGNESVSIGYDPSTNSSGSFTGDGREVLFRNGAEFMTPNSANTGFHNDVLVLKDGSVGIGTNSPVQKLHVVGNGYFTADVVAYYSSDKRLKDNIKNIDNAIDKIQQLNGVEFDWNNKQDVYTGHDIGVIAQEIEEVLPEITTTREDGYKAVKYEKIVPLLIEAIKEQQQQINELKEKLNG